MSKSDWTPVLFDAATAADASAVIELALQEDLEGRQDWTTTLLSDVAASGTADVVARGPGVIAGLPVAALVVSAAAPGAVFEACVDDGATVAAGDVLARFTGPVREMLSAERTLLNFLGRLSGVASLTKKFVDEVAPYKARIYDTRKTTPGWRRLEKYAVRCGGGCNHRTGLYDGILIKDNHLAWGAESRKWTPAEAVRRARKFLEEFGDAEHRPRLLEIEVDTLDQLAEVLPERPDVVLLDNMKTETLRQAVAVRDKTAPEVELEASGGVNLGTVAAISATGVERISVGALTHSATWWDVGLDWSEQSGR